MRGVLRLPLPHLSTPGAKYREGADLAEDCAPQANVSKLRAGATAIWITKRRGARPFAAGDGVLFALDEPMRIEWYAEGRAASLPQVSDAIGKGLPTLRTAAEADGRAAQFERRLSWLQHWLPAA